MSIEDILSGVVVAILIGISIISRYRQNRAKNEQTLPQYSDSSKDIIEEYLSYETPKKAGQEGRQRRKSDNASTQNATNRTSQKTATTTKESDKTEKPSRKFNMRDAVIYSEILTPKFKQEE